MEVRTLFAGLFGVTCSYADVVDQLFCDRIMQSSIQAFKESRNQGTACPTNQETKKQRIFIQICSVPNIC